MPYSEAQMRASAQRNHQHRHNGLYGSVKMARQNMQAVIYSTSATPQAKKMAEELIVGLTALAQELYDYRKDLDGITRLPKHKLDEERAKFEAEFGKY